VPNIDTNLEISRAWRTSRRAVRAGGGWRWEGAAADTAGQDSVLHTGGSSTVNSSIETVSWDNINIPFHLGKLVHEQNKRNSFMLSL